ncbi:FecR domain-containing protein [Bdellovibrio sp. NC01]|uniref:FecR domain-containing protein n=1 Tax=Bdellovibrio sp. NC01 TaxID=2220073 RepID=UPI00115797C3|nr:FecR domain-containing protein [Bdellovibrio sp. NC01]QDK38265.1 hypothetical protein DOE51_12085 [Bdellovibrio sp. NC01]
MSRLGKTEKIIFSTALFVLLAFSYFLYDDSLLFPKAHNSKLELIGDVAVSQNDVRRKNLDNFSWLPASRTDAIYQNDSIFTGDRSEAIIQLQDGTQIRIQPNSLITLNMKNGQMNLDLRYGNLVGDIAKGSSLTITSGKEEFKLEGDGQEKSKIQFNKAHSGTVDLKLISGKARFSDVKKSAVKTDLTRDSVLAVSKRGEIQKVEAPKIQVVTAEKEMTWMRTNPDDPMGFEWKATGDIGKYEVEISPSPDFATVAAAKSVNEMKTQVTDPLEPGAYYWRVKAYDRFGEVGATSVPRKMNITHLSPPVVTFPQKDSEISLEMKVKSPAELVTATEIKWQAPVQLKHFVYQISADPSFAQVLSENQTTQFSALSPRLSSGSYWVRVAGQTETNAMSGWSEAIPFKINLVAKAAPALQAPVLVARRIQFKVPSAKDRNPAAEQAPKMEWKPVLQSKGYQVQVSKDINFSKFETYDVNNTKVSWNQYKAGKSYFRVVAHGENGEVSEPSAVGYVDVLLNSPVLQPLRPIRAIGESSLPREANVYWSEIPQAKSYLVELDKGGDFKTPQQYEFKGTTGRLTVSNPGDYKVRVVALDEHNKPLTDYSNTETLQYSVHSALITPVPLEPYNNVSIFLQKTTEPAIWIEWKKVKDAEVYKVEISDKEDFSRVLVSSNVEKNRFLIKDKVPLGKLYWRVRAQSKDESELSDWTEKREFTVYHQKNETF